MSVAPGRNPLPRKVWNQFVRILEANGIAVEERQVAFVDDVGDEYASFALLYIKEGADAVADQPGF